MIQPFFDRKHAANGCQSRGRQLLTSMHRTRELPTNNAYKSWRRGDS